MGGRPSEREFVMRTAAAVTVAVAILANSRPELRAKLEEFRERQEQKVRALSLP